jgi:hypothetical protein
MLFFLSGRQHNFSYLRSEVFLQVFGSLSRFLNIWKATTQVKLAKKKDGRAPGLVSCQTLSSTRGKRYRMWTEKKMLDAQVRSALGFLSNCIYVNFDGQS